MAASPQQGTYVGTTLAGFTALAAGLVLSASYAVVGWVIVLAGLGLLAMSAAGFYRLKQLEAGK